jgi:alpha-L-fucosidase
MPASRPSVQEPTVLQREFISRGYGMFIHFGINTFNETEWSYGNLPIESYKPTALDCDQWIRVAKEAGFRHVVLTTKHVDGFCLWDSALTDYDVGASPVKTDIVADVAKACRKYGVKLGLYYSLWDTHEPSQKNDMPRYVDYMKGQITELLTRYGPVCEFWFDAPWATPADTDWCYPELRELIHQLQPGCAVTVNHTVLHATKPRHPSLPVDFAHGSKLRFWPVDFRAKDPDLVRSDDPKIYTAPDERQVYLPFEHTVCISDLANWFQKKTVRPARSADELEALFYWCTANDNVLLLNIPPDQTGRLRANEVEAALAVADLLGIRGGDTPLPTAPVNQALGVNAEADSNSGPDHAAAMAVDTKLEGPAWQSAATPATITLSPATPFRFDRLVLHEAFTVKDLGDKFSQLREFAVQQFTVEALQGDEWRVIHEGETIGAVRTLRFPALQTADQLRVRILAASRPAGLRLIEVSDTSIRCTPGLSP